MSLLELFCAVDDFCRQLEPAWQQQQLASGLRQRQRTRQLCLSEIMTILIAFHCSGYRNFKTYYQEQVCRYWRAEFPGLVSYSALCRVHAVGPACPCAPICALVWAPAPAFRFWIPRRWPSATTIAFTAQGV